MKSVVRIGTKSKGRRRDYDEAVEGDQSQIDVRAELIQSLIPVALEAVNDLLQQEVESLAGSRYGRSDGDYARWGRNRGSVYLGDQKVAVTVPRVCDQTRLPRYRRLQPRRHLTPLLLVATLRTFFCAFRPIPRGHLLRQG